MERAKIKQKLINVGGACRLWDPSPRSTSSGGIDPQPSPVIVRCFILLIFLFLKSDLRAHEGEVHEKEQAPPTIGAVHLINKEYLRTVKPIFRQKCFDCHSNQTRYPWYYSLPGAKQFIDYDAREAKKHLDMSDDFPFGDAHPPIKQLEFLKEVVEQNKMPLWRYRLLHWGAALTEEEKKAILNWIEFAKGNFAADGAR